MRLKNHYNELIKFNSKSKRLKSQRLIILLLYPFKIHSIYILINLNLINGFI